MTKNTMQVEVTLMPVITSVIAEPGDLLMVLNGICIGVSTAKRVERPAVPVAITPRVKPRKRPSKRKSPDHVFTTKLRAQIVEVLIKEAPHPLTASGIRARLPEAMRATLGNMTNYGNLVRSLNLLGSYEIVKKLPSRQYMLADPAITGIAEDRNGSGGAIVITAVKNDAADKPMQRPRSAA
jgi:hypothetical protein